jgi:Polysaccharide deacetylase
MWNDTILEAIRLMPTTELDLTSIGLGQYTLATQPEKTTAAYSIIKQLKYLPSEKRLQLSEYISRQVVGLPNNLMLNNDELKTLQQQGMEIGGHTVTHPILANLPADSAEQEIRTNKKALEQLLGIPIHHFAYPNGKPGQDYLPAHVEMVQRAGYHAAFSTSWGVANNKSQPWQLPRFTPWDKTPIVFMLRMLKMYLYPTQA